MKNHQKEGGIGKKGGIVNICATCILTRSDKTKDRVEISAEQLSVGVSQAEVNLFFFNCLIIKSLKK